MTDFIAQGQMTTPGSEDDEFTGPEPRSSSGVLASLRRAEDAFRDWQTLCSDIDRIYNLDGYSVDGVGSVELWQDAQLDLFWSSFEVMKPAIYARPPQPVVSPIFKDSRRLPNVTAELLERCAVSTLVRTNINDVMIHCRDDILFTGRGVQWVTYEADSKGKRACAEYVDRKDFLHETTRTWEENGWVAKRSWLTRSEMRKRFRKTSGDAYKGAQFQTSKERDGDRQQEDRATSKKAGVWEVWHRADGKVYWVAPGVEVFLDEGEPHLELSGFFPCPRPAFGTLRRRSLIPVPDYSRYRVHFRKISELTGRIYLLLDSVKMRGLVAGGSDVGDAVKQMLQSDDDQIIIEVPAAALMSNGAELVTWLPLNELAEAIQGLIAARSQLIDDFYQLSGISDIMRGASEENETLGAQQLKTQYGSVRVRDKSAELQRLAADTVKIISEIIAQKFDQDTLLEMSQMDIPTRREIKARVKEIEDAAKGEIKAIGEKAKEAAQSQQGQIDPQQAQMMLQQAQQQILAKYAPMLAEVEQKVAIEDVVDLLRDEKALGFTFEIESSSTILVDEIEEKNSRNEFMQVFTDSMAKLASAVQLGEAGIKLWGEATKFQLAPYRAGRTMDSAIDQFIDEAPKIAERMAAAQSDGQDAEGLAAAQDKLAEAEMEKAKADMAAVQAKAALDKAELQRKMIEMQQKAMEAENKAATERQKLELQMADMSTKAEQAQRKLEADIDKIRAETVQILQNVGLAQRQQEMAEFQSVADVQLAQGDQQLAQQGQQDQRDNADRDHERAERGEARADRQQDFTEQSTDRQMSLAEREADRGGE